MLPALFVAVAVVVVCSRLWLPAWRLGDIRLDSLAALFYVANWRFVLSGQSYFATGVVPSPLRHTWSLSIEEQYYVLWPLIAVGIAAVAGLRTRRVVAVVAGLGAIASAVWMAVAAGIGFDLSRIYYGTDTRAFALFAGAWLAAWWDPAEARATGRRAKQVRARRWSLAGGIALVPLLVAFVLASTSEVAFYQGGFQLAAVISVVVVAGVATGHGPLATVLGHPALVWIGRRSYGIYLWSWPTQIFAQEHFGLSGLTLDAVVVGVSVGLATLSHRFVEEPIRTGTSPFPARRSAAPTAGATPVAPAPARRPRLPRPALAALSLVAVVGIVVATTAGAPPPPDYTSVTDEEALAAAIEPMTDAERALLEATTTTVPTEMSPPGPFSADGVTTVVDPEAQVDPSIALGRPLQVMIAGDSVGWSLGWLLGPTLTPTVRPEDKALIGCGLMPWTSKFVIGDRAPEQYPELCEKADLAELQGLSRSPDAVLLWAGAWEVYDHEVDGVLHRVGSKRYAAFLEERIQFRVDRYRAAGAVTIMPLVPCFAENAARLGTERLDPERVEWVNDRIRAVAERNTGWMRLIDPSAQLCDADGESIPETPDGIPLREDGSHFDPPAAVWFWNTWLAGNLGAAFDVPAPPTPVTTTTTTTVPAGAPPTSTSTSTPGASGAAPDTAGG